MKKRTASYIKDYPRPQLVRENWKSLNGSWRFHFDDEKKGIREGWYQGVPGNQQILVPFTYETEKSGIGEEVPHFCVWYERILPLSLQDYVGKRVIVHFEGCDYRTIVWINGRKAGEHLGGYTRFSFDITEELEEQNIITVMAEDSFDEQQLRGKQRWREESFRCWYVQTTGIWKDVWLEIVDPVHLTLLKMTPNIHKGEIVVEADIERGQASEITADICISFAGREIAHSLCSLRRGSVTAAFDIRESGEDSEQTGIHYWTPEFPELYDIKIRLQSDGKCVDIVRSYFGMREITTNQGNVLLNGEPIFQRLVLDQGYWKESGLTPPSEEAIRRDIELTKKLGFNGARKHQKTEDEKYYYWCDVEGLLVWCESPSAYRFGDRSACGCMNEWIQMVQQFYNHPSIVVWTAFNESWGIHDIRTDRKQQQLTEAVYHMIKTLDDTRLVISNDGWEHTVSDIITLHDYEEDAKVFRERYGKDPEKILSGRTYHNLLRPAFADGYTYAGQPILISEYGGIAFQNEQIGWGYGNKVKTPEEFMQRYEEITEAVAELPYVCGYCYTQLTDVQQEINGLLNENRKCKTDLKEIGTINEKRFQSKMKEVSCE